MEKWAYEIEGGGIKIELSLRLFAWEAITAALYPFTDRCSILPKLKDAETVSVLFELKSGVSVPLTDLVKAFSNELLDQQLRFQLNREFGSVRDAIVQRAFAPVSKLPP